MTPAIKLVIQAKVRHEVHQYAHDPEAASYGLEAAQNLGVEVSKVYKTLVVKLDTQQLCVAILPVVNQLSMKHIAKAAAAKKAVMADKTEVERVTGYVLGGVSPLGQKKRLPTYIDVSAQSLSSIYVSAGKRGLEVALSPIDLADLLSAKFALLIQ